MSKSTKQCKHCMKTYECGFWGTGSKYCSHECAYYARKYRAREWYKQHRKQRDESRVCVLCKRNILYTGKRRHINKYCSNRCMEMAQRIRYRESKFVTIRIPIKDIPFIFGGKI